MRSLCRYTDSSTTALFSCFSVFLWREFSSCQEHVFVIPSFILHTSVENSSHECHSLSIFAFVTLIMNIIYYQMIEVWQ